MAEENGLTATETTEDSTTAVPIIDKEGNFDPNWRGTLDEDLRNEKSLESFKSYKSLARAFVDTKKMVGKDKITLPGEKATPEEWNAFYAAAGRPKAKEDYQLPVPAELKDVYQKELIDEARDIFHKAGFNQKQVDTLWAFERKRILQGLKEIEDGEQEEVKNAENDLRTKWGRAYDQNLHIVNRIIEENTDGELKTKLLADYGNDPIFAEFVEKIGRKFVEHRIITSAQIPTPSDLDTKIKELMQTDAYSNPRNIDHKDMVDRVQRLFVEKAQAKGLAQAP